MQSMPATSFLWQAVLLEGLIMSNYVFGIDFGSTNSCVAYVDETGRATVINNREGTNTTPSVVNFASPTQVVVGQIAKENAVIDPENTVSLVKALMGMSSYAITYNGGDKSPEEVSSYILRKLARDASDILDTEVKDVVIAYPVYFGSQEIVAIKSACELAGLNLLDIICEPIAAAMSYGCVKVNKKKTVLVYDLGGATLDITAISINSGKITIVCSDGNHQLGGKDWDTEVMNYLATQFCSETGFDGDFDEYAQQDLRLKAEKAKQQLSSREEVPVVLNVEGLRARIILSRTKFEEITKDLLNETIEKTDVVFAVAKEKGYSIDEIILVGGSTKMPQVSNALVEKYGIVPKVFEPDEAVAKGAAIYAFDNYGFKPFSPAKEYVLKVLAEGDEMRQSIILNKWQFIGDQNILTKEFVVSNCGSGEINLDIYESTCLDSNYPVEEDLKLATIFLGSSDLKHSLVVEVKIAFSIDGCFDICCRDLLNDNKMTKVRFEPNSKLISK